jgi:hypothetical protein
VSAVVLTIGGLVVFMCAQVASTHVARRLRARAGLPLHGSTWDVVFDLCGCAATALMTAYGLVVQSFPSVFSGAAWVLGYLALAIRHGLRVHRIGGNRPRFQGPWFHMCALDVECRALGIPERLYIHPLRLYVDFEDADAAIRAWRTHQ